MNQIIEPNEKSVVSNKVSEQEIVVLAQQVIGAALISLLQEWDEELGPDNVPEFFRQTAKGMFEAIAETLDTLVTARAYEEIGSNGPSKMH